MARIYAPSQYLQIWQQVVSTLQDIQENAVSEIDLLQSQIDAIERQRESLERNAEQIQYSINHLSDRLNAQLAEIDRRTNEQIDMLRQQYVNAMMAVYNRIKEVGQSIVSQMESQMPEEVRLLSETTDWLEKIYNFLTTGVPSAQLGGITTREGLYRLHAGEIILPRNANIKVEIDSDKLGKSIASSLMRAGVVSERATSIHLHIDGREIASITAEQIRRGHPELIKQVRRLTH